MHSTPRVSAIAVLDLHDRLLQLGAVTADELQAAALHRPALQATLDTRVPLQEQRLDETLLIALWQLATNNARCAAIGLHVGSAFSPSSSGLLASWLQQCTTLAEALQVFQEHIALMNPSEHWHSQTVGTTLRLEFAFNAHAGYPKAAIERSMSALLVWAQAMSGQALQPLACDFSFARPAYLAEIQALFGHNVRFQQPYNRIHLRHSDLQRTIHSANPYLKQIMAERARQALQQLHSAGDLPSKVRLLISSNLHNGSTIESVCAQLHISRATLYRRLKPYGCSFSQLLESSRSELAQAQLRQGKAISQVSDELGFKDVGTFHRAFKRWFGQSPGAYRKGALAR